MARFDSGVRYDEDASYDEPDEPATPPITRMAKIRRNWSRLALPQRLAKAKQVVDGITANPTVLPSPAPTLAALTALYEAAKDAADLLSQKEVEIAALRQQVRAKADALLVGLNAEASTSEGATGGNPEQLILLGWDLADTAPTSVGELAKITELTVTAGDDDGELDLQWHPEEGAGSYEVQTTTTIDNPASWVHQVPSTKSSKTIAGLPSGSRQWVRVRGIGAAGPGPWSDPVSKIVP